jgi:beta-aspartyl-peptidase (threonine type)
LDRQLEAWNHGDLEGFMAHYWKSDELVFKSPKGETHGWQAVRQRYRQAYPTTEKMGSLTFDLGKIVRPRNDTAEVAGQYRVQTADGNQTGRFYLHFRKIDDAWLIVRDYTVGD